MCIILTSMCNLTLHKASDVYCKRLLSQTQSIFEVVKKKNVSLSGLCPIKYPYLNITCTRQRFLSRSPPCLSPSAHNVRVFPLLLQSLSVHKQSLQSEYSLIKGTNLSPSNQVAELAVAADNSLALWSEIHHLQQHCLALSGARK